MNFLNKTIRNIFTYSSINTGKVYKYIYISENLFLRCKNVLNFFDLFE